MQITKPEIRQSHAVRLDALEADVTGLRRSLDEMGQHYDALLERVGVNWPEVARPAAESVSGAPSSLPPSRLKTNQLAKGIGWQQNVSTSPPSNSSDTAEPAKHSAKSTTAKKSFIAKIAVRRVAR